MAVLCGMPTIQYSARSAWLSVPLSKCASKDNVWSKQFDIRRIAAVDGSFNVIRQVTATCPPMRAHWRHLANTIELAHPLPTWVHNRNAKSISSAVFAQMTAECHYTLQWSACFPLKIAPPMLARRRHAIRASLGPPKSGAQMATWSLQPFFFQDSLVWQTDIATDRPTDQATRCNAT